jgi:exodeoxyribonuclease V alpha subunit
MTVRIVESIAWLMDQGIAFEDIEVLTPINKGCAGRIELNKYMQHEYNRGQAVIKGIPFRANDKVIHVRNNYKLGIMNGEVGTVTRIDVMQHGKDLVLAQGKDYYGTPTDSVWVQYPLHGELVGYNYDNVDQLQLAYALTIHKAQGSQFPAVIVVLPSVYGGFYLRQLPYTAVTRAITYCIVLSPAGVFQQYVQSEERVRRNSMLCQLLKGE